jgi:hypothetical protein
MFLVIILFNAINDSSVVGMIFRVASYTYGPLLVVLLWIISTIKTVKDKFVPLVCCITSYYVLDQRIQKRYYGVMYSIMN